MMTETEALALMAAGQIRTMITANIEGATLAQVVAALYPATIKRSRQMAMHWAVDLYGTEGKGETRTAALIDWSNQILGGAS